MAGGEGEEMTGGVWLVSGSQMNKADERQDSWVSYPLGIFAAALRSIVGGFVVVVLALIIGTWCGDLVWNWGDTVGLIATPALTLGILLLAGVQIWGWLYLLLLAWLLYYLIHDEGTRILTLAVIMPLQTAVTILNLWQADGWLSWNWDQVIRVTLAYILFIGIGWIIWRLRKILIRQLGEERPAPATTPPEK